MPNLNTNQAPAALPFIVPRTNTVCRKYRRVHGFKGCFWILCSLLLLIATAADIRGQDLTASLSAEDPGRLASDAKQKGNVVRGAILYHQGNINCAKCHRADGQPGVGPDLTRLQELGEGNVPTDAELVVSILNPSQSIRKGYETTLVATLDGRTFTGILIKKTKQEVQLRDAVDIGNVRRIPVDDIEQMRTDKKSAMPEGLVKPLKNRQQFLDLVRYVIELRDRGPVAETQATRNVPKSRELRDELSGLVKIQQFNCSGCHQTDRKMHVTPRLGPDLNWSASHLNPRHLVEFVANPLEVKAGTAMPDLFGNMPQAERKQVATAIVHFLTAENPNQFQMNKVNSASAERGQELFHTIGCVACHAPRSEDAVEEKVVDSLPLGDLAGKYDLTGLIKFLENPLKVRHSGRMPKTPMSHYEATDLASYLLQGAQPTKVTWQSDPQLAKQGAKYFREFNCAGCHQGVIDIGETPLASTPLTEIRGGSGCLSATGTPNKPGVPNFQLSDDDRAAIGVGLSTLPKQDKLQPDEKIRMSLKAFNCIACHDRGNFGGVTDLRNPHFQTTNLNLGEQGRIPPTLTGVGAKLKPDWFRNVLVNEKSIRPYMKTRMPQYGESNVGKLVALFEKADSLPEIEFAQVKDQKAMRRQGLEMAGNQGLNCVACHTYKFQLSDTMPAVDLTEMAERLQKRWFYRYMLAPQKFSPNTVMPSFWPGGRAIRADIKGDAKFQVEALWQYLIDGRQAGTPRGVVREPLEIVVTDEAKMLRRKYQDVGKRGIGVGYPGEVNLIFDAEQMRLAAVWRGKFLDPAGVWLSQGHGSARPLGRPIRFVKGPDLDFLKQPWKPEDDRPSQHQFLGYELDAKRRPAFRYRIGDDEVSDYFQEVPAQTDGAVQLKRILTVRVDKASEPLRLRLAADEKITKIGDRQFEVGDRGLQMLIVNGPRATITDDGELKQLQLVINPDELKPLSGKATGLWAIPIEIHYQIPQE